MPELRLVLTHEPHDSSGKPLIADATTRLGRFVERVRRLDVFDLIYRNGWVLRDGDDNVLAWTSTAWETADAIAWANRAVGADLEWRWEGDEEDEHLVATPDEHTTAAERIDVLRASARTLMEERSRRRPMSMLERVALMRAYVPYLFLGVALIAASAWIGAGLPSTARPDVATMSLLAGLVLLAAYAVELTDTTRLKLAREVDQLEGDKVHLLVKAATERMRSAAWPRRSSRKFDIAERVAVGHQLVLDHVRNADDWIVSTTAVCTCGWSKTSTRDRKVNLYTAHSDHQTWLVLAQLHTEFPDLEPAPPALLSDADVADLIEAVLATAAARYGKSRPVLDELGAPDKPLLVLAIDEGTGEVAAR